MNLQCLVQNARNHYVATEHWVRTSCASGVAIGSIAAGLALLLTMVLRLLPNRYMHTPVEVIDTTDIEDLARTLGAFAADVETDETFAVDV